EASTQDVEHAAFLERVHISDGDEKEQKQLGIVLDNKLGEPGYLFGLAGLCVTYRDEDPDQAGGDDHGLGFSHRGRFLEDHEDIGEDENEEREKAGPVSAEIDWDHRRRSRMET